MIKKDTLIRLGIKLDTKRKPVFRGDLWVDTIPIEVTDLSCLKNIGKKRINALRHEVNQLQTENLILKDRLSQKEREIYERYKESTITHSLSVEDPPPENYE